MFKKNVVPYVKIVEQPLSRGARFRYECEGRYSGSILGVNTTSTKKSYPSIEIVNHKGAAFVVVSCVTKDPPHRPHPHNLVGKMKELSQGICYFKTLPNQAIVIFPHLGIQCVKKKDVDRSLTERERLKVDPFKTGFNHKYQPDSIDLNCIRLCFQVFLEGQESGNFNIPLDPVVSNPIYDKKGTAELSICWLSHASASVVGGKVMCILCEKITKDDVQVRFFREENRWEAIAESVYPHYHKQVALIFKSPKYFQQDINEPVSVLIQLKRSSDGELSKPVPFQFLPIEVDDHDMLRRKRRKFNEAPRSLVFRHLQAEAAKNAALLKLAESQDCGVIRSKPPIPEYFMSPSMLHSPMSNNLNMFRDSPTSFNNMSNNPQSRYVNQYMQRNEIPEFDCLSKNPHKQQISRLYNNSAMIRQKQNLLDTNDFNVQPFNEIYNEPQAQSNAFMNEMLSTITNEKISNDLPFLNNL